MGRKDGRHTDEVELGDARRPERHLEAGELLAVLTDALGEKDLFRDVGDTHCTAFGESPNRIVPHPQVCRLIYSASHTWRLNSASHTWRLDPPPTPGGSLQPHEELARLDRLARADAHLGHGSGPRGG